jgi:sensor c-di-GMP phosphodiesterase-like protein
MAHNLGLDVIAEGVETAEQAAFLLNHDCEGAQGYLYSKPLPPTEFAAYLRNHQLAQTSEQMDKPISRQPRFQRRAGKQRRAPAG